jgi:hypothetical protein
MANIKIDLIKSGFRLETKIYASTKVERRKGVTFALFEKTKGIDLQT